MVTLKQLINEQRMTGMSDIDIIRNYLTINDLEEEGMDLIYQLSASKINKLKLYKKNVQDWISYLPSRYLYENYDLETADKLHELELDFLSYGSELSNRRLEWARENAPKIKMPKVYFRPLLDYLSEKEIRFKGSEKYYGKK